MATLVKRKKDGVGNNTISNKTNVLFNFMFILYTCACILPIVLVVAVSLSSEMTIIDKGYNFFPQDFTGAAYSYIFTQGSSILKAYGVTIFVTVLGTFLSVFVIALYAYPISRKDFKYRNAFTFFVFFTMIFNGGLVPWYMMYSNILHLRNSMLAMIIPMLMNAWYILILRTFYVTTVPDSIIESARIDGAGEFRTFVQIVLPLSLPGLATVGLFQTLAYWNDWFNCLMFIEDNALYNLQYLMYKIMINIQVLGQGSKGAIYVDVSKIPGETARMAICVLSIGPIIFAYPFFQQYFIKGLTVGAVKG